MNRSRQPTTTAHETGIFIRQSRSFDLTNTAQRKKFIAEQTARLKQKPVLSDIEIIEMQLVALLRALGYPETLPELSMKIATMRDKGETIPWPVRDAEAALEELHQLRQAIEQNKIDAAVRHAFRAMQSGMKAIVGVVEPLAREGRGRRKERQRGGEKTARQRKAQGEATRAKVLDKEHVLRKNNADNHAINKIIAADLNLTPQRVGQIRKRK